MTKRPRPPHHNHTTRDIKPIGECPACDRYHAKYPPTADASLHLSMLEKHKEVNDAFPKTYLAITLERFKATQKHGNESINALAASDPRWLAILMEEVGEAAAELNYDAAGSLRAELVQVAAVACAWIDAIDEEQER